MLALAEQSSSTKKKMSKGKKKAIKAENGAKSTQIQISPPNCRRARNSSPGVRLVGRRIYDSSNGKTCHQCRQKTVDFSASCKRNSEVKKCTIQYCHKCLINRYGENAEEVALLDDWLCPKCRGICNCSFCMKKRGQQPTGILSHRAKANGFASVSQMLHLDNSETTVSPDGEKASNKEFRVAVTKKRKKGSTPEGENDSVLIDNKGTGTSNTKKKKKKKSKGKASDVRIQLPEGITLNRMTAIDLPTKDVCHALQFLEFCEAFGEKIVERERARKLLSEKENERNLKKEMKKKLQDEIAKAILMNNGAPLTVSEHDDLVSRIKMEVVQTLEVAHTLVNTLEASNIVVNGI